MRKIQLATLALSTISALGALACSSDGDGDGAEAAAVLTNSSDASEDDCADGGTVLSIGTDEDGNGSLEAGEVQTEVTSCNGVAGDKGDEGTDGDEGEVGADGNDGPDGNDGADGNDGCGTLVRSSVVAPGNECAAGGVLIEFGSDSLVEGLGGSGPACDGIIDDVLGSELVCTGENGLRSLVRIVEASAACLDGGFWVQSGLDDNDDGVLQAGEVDADALMCENARRGFLPEEGSDLLNGTLRLAEGTYTRILTDACPATSFSPISTESPSDLYILCNNGETGTFDFAHDGDDGGGNALDDAFLVIYEGGRGVPEDALQCSAADDDDGGDSNSLIEDYTVEAGECISIVVAGYSNTNIGDYLFTVTRD